jgi:hypothetical protein
MGRPLAGDVKTSGAGKDRGIVVGGAVVQQHQLARAHGDVPDPQVGTGVPGDAAAAPARSAQYLLHGAGDQARITGESLLLAGIGQQAQGAHADRHHGRLVAGEQQGHRQHRDLVITEVVGAQPGDEVVTRLLALAGHQLPAIDEQVTQPLLGTGPVTYIADGLAPGAELVTVGIRHAEQLADDLDGQGQGQGLVQVRGRPVLGQVAEQARGQLFHPGPERAHAPGREMRLQERAQAGIVGLFSVEVAHRPAEQRRLPQARGLGGIGVGPAEPVIRQQAAYLLVAGDQPGLVAYPGADPVDHALLLQLAQQWRYLQRMSLLERQLNRHV